MKIPAAAIGLLALASAAHAQGDEPRFCPNRPSIQSSACTTEPGRVHVEVSAMDWTLDKGADARTDTFLPGDLLVRLGIGAATELQFGWSPVGHVRERDQASGAVSHDTRVGDVRLALRQSLRRPDSKGLSYGVEPFVTLPVGRTPVGAGTWGAGVVLPVTYDLNDTVNIGLTGELHAEPDADGHGRHFQGIAVAATSLAVSDAVSLTLESEVIRDRDPAGHETQAVAGLGVQWKVAPTRAFYAEAVGGLNRNAPDVQLYAGVAALF